MHEGHVASHTAWWYPAPGEMVDWLACANALPFCQDIGLVCVELNPAWATFRMERSTLSPNPNGAVNGGIVAAAPDQVMGALTMRMSTKDCCPLPAHYTFSFTYPLGHR